MNRMNCMNNTGMSALNLFIVHKWRHTSLSMIPVIFSALLSSYCLSPNPSFWLCKVIFECPNLISQCPTFSQLVSKKIYKSKKIWHLSLHLWLHYITFKYLLLGWCALIALQTSKLVKCFLIDFCHAFCRCLWGILEPFELQTFNSQLIKWW